MFILKCENFEAISFFLIIMVVESQGGMHVSS